MMAQFINNPNDLGIYKITITITRNRHIYVTNSSSQLCYWCRHKKHTHIGALEYMYPDCIISFQRDHGIPIRTIASCVRFCTQRLSIKMNQIIISVDAIVNWLWLKKCHLWTISHYISAYFKLSGICNTGYFSVTKIFIYTFLQLNVSYEYIELQKSIAERSLHRKTQYNFCC